MLHAGILSEKNLPAFAGLLPRDIWELRAPGTVFLAVADESGVPAGVLAASADLQGARLLYLFVAPPFRRGGAATLLLETFARAFPPPRDGFALSCIFCGEEDENLSAFLSSVGFAVAPCDGGVFRGSLGEFLAHRLLAPARETRILPYFDIPHDRRLALFAALHTTPFREEDALPQSRAFLTGGRLGGVAAISRDGAGLCLSWLYVSNPAARENVGLLAAVCRACAAAYGTDTEVTIHAVNPASFHLAKKFCPDYTRATAATVGLADLALHLRAARRAEALLRNPQ
jgi:GNAT superfamily N-acetyltransferase